MLLQVAKKSEELDPDPSDFRVYISLKTGSVGGCSGSQFGRLGLRNLGSGSEGILIYTLRGVLGGFGTSFSTSFWTPKKPPRPPPADPLVGGDLDPNRPNPKRSGGLAYSTLSGYCVVRQLDLIPPLEPVRDPWTPPRTPPGGPSWIFRDFALLATLP
jgi:hypothetical protein